MNLDNLEKKFNRINSLKNKNNFRKMNTNNNTYLIINAITSAKTTK